MNSILIFLVSVLPVFLIGLYIYNKDRDKEPTKLILKLFFLGFASVLPAAFIETSIGAPFGDTESLDLVTLFFYVFIVIALVEELFKWIIAYFCSFKSKEFNQLYDGIIYCVFVSLGFACLENLFYVADSGVSVGIMRALLAVPGHACDAIIMGYFMGLAKEASIINNGKYKKYLFYSILFPTITHGIYDYCLFSNLTVLIILFFIFVISLYIYCIIRVKKTAKLVNNFIDDNTIISNDLAAQVQAATITQTQNIQPINKPHFCSQCGKFGSGYFCTNCGNKMN